MTHASILSTQVFKAQREEAGKQLNEHIKVLWFEGLDPRRQLPTAKRSFLVTRCEKQVYLLCSIEHTFVKYLLQIRHLLGDIKKNYLSKGANVDRGGYRQIKLVKNYAIQWEWKLHGVWGWVLKSEDWVQIPGFLAVWPWASHLTSLCLNFFICKIMIIVVSSHRVHGKSCYNTKSLEQYLAHNKTFAIISCLLCRNVLILYVLY